MHNITLAVRRFMLDEEGATMAEYALLVALIAIAVIAGARQMGSKVNSRLCKTANVVQTGDSTATDKCD